MRKKIAIFCTLPPPVHGSAMVSQYIKDSEYIKSEFDMEFVNISTSRKMSEIGKNNPVLLLKKLLRFLGSYLQCIGMLIAHKHNLCYLAITCHGIGFIKDMPFVLLCKMFGRKVVIHQHNKGMSADIDRAPYKWLIPFSYKNTKVILLSWRLYPDIEKVVKKENVMVCPNGIPPLEEVSKGSEFMKVSNRVPRLLYLSNLIVSKGVYVLLDACKILKEKGVAFICDFVGGESKEISREDFNTAVSERGLDEMAVYHGPKYGADKELFWNQADVFVFPTYYYNECFPLVLLEAMQHGVACVSTDEGGIPDIIEDSKTGYVCQKQNAEDLASKLEMLIQDQLLRETMGRAGYEKYNREYTLRCFEENMLAVLKGLL